jgi:CarboxypepD_reg-like domain
MIRHLIFIGLLFSISHPVIYCQTPDYITGKVIDSKTSQPVSYATVRLKNSEVGIHTNAEGDFRILNSPGFQSDSLIVTCIGYRRLSVSFGVLKMSEKNDLKLVLNIYGLNEVSVIARKRRLNPEIIIGRALQNIKKNNPVTPFSYVSYYRDYLKDSSNYLNLNEAIIQTLDKGFAFTTDSSRHRLLEFKKNMDFRQIEISPYYDIPGSVHSDVSFKQMPMAYVGDHNGNEFFVLLTHDAIRNFDQKTFFFIDNLTTKFLKNHMFSRPDGIYDGNTLLYKISFEARPKITENTYEAKGAIFIQPTDYSIHRLEYSASFLNKEKKKQEIFNIEIEYGHEPALKSKMCLKYISFNNSFIIPDTTDNDFFKIVNGRWISAEPYKDRFSVLTTVVVFNNEIDSLSARDRKKYDITIGDAKARIRKIKVDGRNLYLTLYNDKFNVALDSCKINIKDLKDINGNILNKRRDLELRQYREMFVQEYDKQVGFQNGCFIESVPLRQNCISHSENVGRFWMNTPLKAEEKQQDSQNH